MAAADKLPVIVTPTSCHIGHYAARLDGDGRVLCVSRTPFFDTARKTPSRGPRLQHCTVPAPHGLGFFAADRSAFRWAAVGWLRFSGFADIRDRSRACPVLAHDAILGPIRKLSSAPPQAPACS